MASLIKNQIVKHLSKFAKNINPDHISVEVLKGKGELHNIELNETLITEALELPAWLKIQRAVCNRVAIKIPWTSLKSQPVTLLIDEIRVDVVMSSDLREMKPHQSGSTLSSSTLSYDTGYGFANKVAEGMSLNINSLEIFFTSEVFGGSLTLNQFRVASCTPFWKTATDLRQTRIREPNLNQALLFKQVSWQLLRIEASTLGDSIATGYNINAPLRLITSQGRARITVKKSTVDGSVLTGRMQIILDDLLWVATLPQVRSAISFYRYLMKLIQTASDSNKSLHAEKILQQSDLAAKMAVNSSKPVQSQANSSAAQLSSVFKQFDVVATSYHFYAGFIDLHICDDSNTDVKYPPNWNFNSGALQVSLSKLACDFYPYHLASRERDYWVHYHDTKCRQWVRQLLDHYYKFFSSNADLESRRFETEWPKLMSQCCVVRLDDFTVYCVSEATSNGKQKKLEKLIGADHEILKLPGSLPLIHVEFADYYYGSDCNLPVPPSCTHVQVNPVRIFVDLKTIRWMSYIYLDLCKTLGLDTSSVDLIPHSDVRIEALMPRIVFPAQNGNVDKKMPNSLIVQISSYTVTNCLIGEPESNQNKLKTCLTELENVDLFRRTFAAKTSDKKFHQLPNETEAIRLYLTSLQDFLQCGSVRKTSSKYLNRNAFHDVWTYELNPIWIDFAFSKSSNPRPTPFFVDSAIAGWALLGNKSNDGVANAVDNATGYIIVQPKAPLKFALDHYQYLFFVETMEQVSKFMVLLNDDAKCFYETMEPKSLAVTCLAPLIEMTLILPVSVAPTSPSDSYKLNDSHILDVSSSAENVDVRSNQGRETFDDHGDDVSCGDSNNLVEIAAVAGQPILIANQNIPEYTGFSMDADAISYDPPLSSTFADDTISVHTDMSDDDQFVVLDNGEPSMFDEIFPRNKDRSVNPPAGADVGEEACEIQPPNAHAVDLITKHLQRQVSIIVFKLRQVQLTVTGYDQESYVTFQSPFVEVAETSNLTLEEVYKTLNSKSVSSTDRQTYDTNGEYQIKLSVITDGDAEPAHLDADLKNIEMNISSTNLASLATFLENENLSETSPTDVVPIRIKVSNTKLNVGDAKNLNSTRLIVSDAWILQGNKNWPKSESNDESKRVKELEMENAELRQKLADAKAFVQEIAKNNYDLNL